MKYSNKMVLVPFTERIKDPNVAYLRGLDYEMSSIVNNSQLKPDEKVKLYNQALERLMTNIPESDNQPKIHVPQKKLMVDSSTTTRERAPRKAHLNEITHRAPSARASRGKLKDASTNTNEAITPRRTKSVDSSKDPLNVNNTLANTLSKGFNLNDQSIQEFYSTPAITPGPPSKYVRFELDTPVIGEITNSRQSKTKKNTTYIRPALSTYKANLVDTDKDLEREKAERQALLDAGAIAAAKEPQNWDRLNDKDIFK